MNELSLASYRLSIWENQLKSEVYSETLTDQTYNYDINYTDQHQLCEIANSNSPSINDAQNIKLTLKDNGEITLYFELQTSYWSIDEGKIIDNPYLQFITAEQIVKLLYHDNWYDFVITNISHENKGKKVVVSCVNAFTTELGHTGYNIEFNTELENNLNSAYKLGYSIVENSDWNIIDNNGKICQYDKSESEWSTPAHCSKSSDLIQEHQDEYLYFVKVGATFTAQKLFGGETKTFTTNTNIYVFSACLNFATTPYAFIELDLSDSTILSYINNNEVIQNTDQWIITSNITVPDSPNYESWYIPTINSTPIFQTTSIVLESKIRAKRFVQTATTIYDNLLEQYTTVVKLLSKPSEYNFPSDWAVNDLLREYEDTKYLTSIQNNNIIANASNFTNHYGWTPIVWKNSSIQNEDPTIELIEQSGVTTQYPGLNLVFKNNSSYRAAYLNSGFTDNKSSFKEGLNGSNSFVLKIKAFSGNKTAATYLTSPNLNCQLWDYQIVDGKYEKLNKVVLDFSSSSWQSGAEYSITLEPETCGKTVYTYDEDTGNYTAVYQGGSYKSDVNYYVQSGTYAYKIASIQNGAYSYDTLFNSTSKFGLFIFSTDSASSTTTSVTYHIADFEVFAYIPKPNSNIPYLPEEVKPVNIQKTYNYYKPNSSYVDKVQYTFCTYSSALPESVAKIQYDNNCQKVRSITGSKSNRYNLLSTLCENFECWMQLTIPHDSIGKLYTYYKPYYEQLTTDEVTVVNSFTYASQFVEPYYYIDNLTYTYADAPHIHEFFITDSERIKINEKNSGTYYYYASGTRYPWILPNDGPLPENMTFYDVRIGVDKNRAVYRKKYIKGYEKYITFHEHIGTIRSVGFKYGLNTTSITRTVASDSIITKLIVEENNNQYTASGYCSISDAYSNPSGESIIYNFNHYINNKLLDGNDVVSNINTLNQNLYKYNKTIQDLNVSYLAAADQVDSWLAKKSVYDAAYSECGTEIADQKTHFLQLTNVSYENFDPDDFKTGGKFEGNSNAKTIYETIASLQLSYANYKVLLDTSNASYNTWLEKKSNFYNSITNYSSAKKVLCSQFEQKYASYIREGTWQSEDYDNAETYYLDACTTSENAAYPKVSYKLNVIDISGLEEYSNYSFNIGDRTWIEDEEIFGYDSDGFTPLKKEVAITEISYNLNNPNQNTISIATFKDEFVDLFSKFQATTQKLEYAAAAYDSTTGIINKTGISSSVLQKTLNNNNIILGQDGEQGISIDSSGISLISKNNPNNWMKLIGSGLFISNDGGLNWTAGVTGSGINTSVLNSGFIYANKINILDENSNSAFRWDSNGINAYSFYNDDPTKMINESKFVRFDRFGIYGYNGTSNFVPSGSSDDDILNNTNVEFSLTWSGLHIRTYHQELIPGALNTYGGIRIDSNNDFSVYDGYTTRIKIGLMKEGTISSYATYGMRLNGRGGNVALELEDNGNLWLANELLINGDAIEDAKIHFGITGRYSGWETTIVSEHERPWYPISHDAGSITRILSIPDPGLRSMLIQTTLKADITAFNIQDPSEQVTFSSGTTIYVLDTSLLDNDDRYMQFVTLTSSELSDAISTKWVSDDIVHYSVDVDWSSTQSGDYIIPYLKGTYTYLIDTVLSTVISGVTIYSNYFLENYKLEIYDDGTLRTPHFIIDSEGNVYLDSNDSAVLYAPTFQADKSTSRVYMNMTNTGWKIVTNEDPDRPRIRLEMCVTEKEGKAINPYIRFIQGTTQDDSYLGQGLIKMYSNGFWFGNATKYSDLSENYSVGSTDRGLFVQLSSQEGAETHAYIAANGQLTELVTGNTKAVFG